LIKINNTSVLIERYIYHADKKWSKKIQGSETGKVYRQKGLS